ncbi:MAG: thioredoxin domain-containing protein [Pseudomonadota bacterium]
MSVKRVTMIMALIFFILFLVVAASPSFSAEPKNIPVKGMVNMVDLGAKKCIPCKMMAPILERLEKRYAGKAAIIFLDVWEDPKPAHHFGIQAIPTQIFFDKTGKEVYRHVGFMSEEAIVTQLKSMGVQ